MITDRGEVKIVFVFVLVDGGHCGPSWVLVKFFSGCKGKQILPSQLKIKKLKRPYPQLFFSFLQLDRLLEDCVDLLAGHPKNNKSGTAEIRSKDAAFPAVQGTRTTSVALSAHSIHYLDITCGGKRSRAGRIRNKDCPHSATARTRKCQNRTNCRSCSTTTRKSKSCIVPCRGFANLLRHCLSSEHHPCLQVWRSTAIK